MKEKKRVETYILGEIKADVMARVLLASHISVQSGVGLRVWLCSNGGDLTAALAIHDTLRRHPDAEVIATGDCQSAALVALMGARRRLATPNTLFLNHGISSPDGDVFPSIRMPATVELAKLPQGYFNSQEAIRLGVLEAIWEGAPVGASDFITDEEVGEVAQVH